MTDPAHQVPPQPTQSVDLSEVLKVTQARLSNAIQENIMLEVLVSQLSGLNDQLRSELVYSQRQLHDVEELLAAPTAGQEDPDE